MSYFTLSNVIGSVEDIEITIESPVNRESVPAQVQEISSGTFKVRIGREKDFLLCSFCYEGALSNKLPAGPKGDKVKQSLWW